MPSNCGAHLFMLMIVAVPFLSVRLAEGQEESTKSHSISGQVVGPEGEPVAGASVAWAREVRESLITGPIFSSSSSGGSRPLGTAGPDGKFRVSGPPPGPVDLYITAEGYAARKLEGLQLPEDRDLENVKITLERGILLEVQVLDAEGNPVPDAWVQAEPENFGFEPESSLFQLVDADTDSAGRCRLTVPKPGVYWVSVSSDTAQRVSIEPGATHFEVILRPNQSLKSSDRPAEEKSALDGRTPFLSMEEGPRKGFTCTGRILVNGKPLSGGEIHIHGESTFFGPSDISYDGTFTIQGMPAGTSTLVITNYQGFVGTHKVALTEDQNLSIELSTGRLRGQVATVSGKPVEDATVTVNAWIPATQATISAPSGRTGAEGAFEIPGLGVGIYKVKVSQRGFTPIETTAEVTPGGSAAPVTVVLKPQEGM